MIAKLSKGVGFSGLVNYANYIKQKDTNIIASQGVSLTDNKTIASCFQLQAKGNPKVKQYVGVPACMVCAALCASYIGILWYLRYKRNHEDRNW